MLAPLDKAGVSVLTLEVAWDRFELEPGIVNRDYVREIRDRYSALRSAGFQVILDVGLQYPPGWVFDLPGQTRFVNQFGSEFAGGIGDDVPDAVFNSSVRVAQGSYLRELAAAIGDLEMMAVRVGGLGYGELRFPSPMFGSDTNSYWAFSPEAQEQSPVPEWTPGNPDSAKARLFLDWYLDSLAEYAVWLAKSTRQEFPSVPYLHLLLPSWGIRPGEVEQAVSNLLGGRTVGELRQTINQGVDWGRQIRAVRSIQGLQVATTWLDAASDGAGPSDESPVGYLARISGPMGVEILGENTGNNTVSDMRRSIERVQEYGLVGMLWMSAPSLRVAGLASLDDFGALTLTQPPSSIPSE